jgi:adenine deaminase
MNTTQPDPTVVAARRRLIDVLLDPSKYADLVLRGGNVVNVISGEIYLGDVAVVGEHIARVGDCSDLIGPLTNVVNLDGSYLMPGLIDAHMHFESAMLNATEFTRISLPTGTTSVVSDPHEIANVLGPEGVREIAEECALLPTRVHTRVPCRVPDVAPVETCGVDITFDDVPGMLEMPTVDGIGEVQSVGAPNFVFRHTPEVFDDVLKSTTYAREHGDVVDGNAAAIFGNELAAHIIAGGTDISCHETTTKKEALEKLRFGVWVLMREGSTQRNMAECIRAFTEDGLDPRRLCLATDDMLPDDLQARGHMNDVVRRTIAAGIKPVHAIQMATINPATWMGLSDVGVLAPGKLADLCVVSGALEDMNVDEVYLGGKLVAKCGELTIALTPYRYPDWVRSSVKRDPITADELAVEASGDEATVRAVGLIPDQNLSRAVTGSVPVVDGIAQSSVENDILQAAVVERYGRHGGVGRGFINGFGLKRGAIAETVSHNSHNIVVMGTNLDDMVIAVNEVIRIQGGIVMVDGGEIVGVLPLPVAGLINDELSADEMVQAVETMTNIAQQRLGVQVHGPFMHLAFLSLTTSPEWKLTDRGLLDVESLTILPSVIENAVPTPLGGAS